jgi:hypothetical protein
MTVVDDNWKEGECWKKLQIMEEESTNCVYDDNNT